MPRPRGKKYGGRKSQGRKQGRSVRYLQKKLKAVVGGANPATFGRFVGPRLPSGASAVRSGRRGRKDRNILHSLARSAANYFAPGVGGAVVDAGAAIVGQITGHGDYKVRANSLLTNNQVPMFGSTNHGFRIRHREFITDVSSATNFTINNYYINPGLPNTFPWLSTIAAQFEQYCVHGMVFAFKSTSAAALNSTNTALGTIIMATDYDDLDSNFSNKQQMEAYEFASSCAPCNSMMHPVECAPRETPLTKLWVRTVPYTTYSDADPRLYDWGNFQIASVGSQATATVGELWVTYDIEFFKPRLLAPGSTAATARFTGSMNGGSVWTQLLTATGASTPSITLSANVITFANPGQYLVLGAAVAATSVSGLGTWTPTNASWLTLCPSSSSSSGSAGPIVVASSTQSVEYGIINVTTSGGYITVSGATTITGACYGDLYITSMPIGFTLDRGESSLSKRVKLLQDQLEDLKATAEIHESYSMYPFDDPLTTREIAGRVLEQLDRDEEDEKHLSRRPSPSPARSTSSRSRL